ncbi:sigma-70 family RNA polymerase sigma factor [Bacillus sp. Au-Bac7]|uniref:sigma-70 family RNA polymerase sigma factor n=1 Tax=Bacillus sp. Au-Bac7 TaxID=2906458 RepID=UPI001E3B855C|nr:sigma-70 family RNA polymerase sigma factor [Bacillus sp. Au-Bac7]MCE4048038.1 sigma-70 family RNA polymerase sigma factor [Bacillus sp. Au-Bac7]
MSNEELIKQYQETLNLVKEQRTEFKDEIKQLKEIFKENKLPGQSIRLSNKRKAAMKERWQELEGEDAPYSLIQGNLEYALSWLKNGHAPGTNRGIERRSVYQNTKPVDPLKMQRYFRSKQPEFAWETEPKENVITPSERMILDKAMKALTKNELEVLLMYKGKGLSQYEIAKLLGISRSSVRSRLVKANEKVAKILQEEKDGETA